MNPSPTFLESLKPQERYELLQKSRSDVGMEQISSYCVTTRAKRTLNVTTAAGAFARKPTTRASSLSRPASAGKQVLAKKQQRLTVHQMALPMPQNLPTQVRRNRNDVKLLTSWLDACRLPEQHLQGGCAPTACTVAVTEGCQMLHQHCRLHVQGHREVIIANQLSTSRI
jgi:hypothetical protein